MTAAGILKAVIAKHKVDPAEFYGKKRTFELVSARFDAAAKLNANRIGRGVIARLMKRDISTVRYYLTPQLRKKRRSNPGRWEKSPHLKLLDPDAKSVVIETAKAEDTMPEVVIAQWVGEYARELIRQRAQEREVA
jgi:hypothetical protein